MTDYLKTHDLSTTDEIQAAVDVAYALATKYGEGAAAMSCEMYDAVAALSGVTLPAAEPAATATYEDAAKTVWGIMKHSDKPEVIGSGVGRLVKMAGVDTTIKNGMRDGAQFAWVPHGDTCAFCLMLASNGWRTISKKALKKGHAEHIHSNCDCTYAVRFDDKSNVAGYDPEKYKKIFADAEGDTWKEKLESVRRKQKANKSEGITVDSIEALEKVFAEQLTSKKSNILVDTIIDSHKVLADYSPEEMKKMLERAGYEVLQLTHSKSGFNKPFEDGGGYKILFGGDGIFRYHPPGGRHKVAYWKVGNSKRGNRSYDMEGNEIIF